MTRRTRWGAAAAALALTLTSVALAPSPAGAASPEATAFVERTLRVLEPGVEPGAGEVDGLAERIDAGTSRRAIVDERIRGDAYQDVTIRDLYDRYFARQPDQAGLDFWSDRLDVRTQYLVRTDLLASGEFLGRNGGTTEGFVEGLYRAILARDADPGGRDFWVGQTTDTPSGRASVALRILRSAEARGLEVDGLYERILARSSDPGGRQHHATRLLTVGIEGVTLDLAASAEAFGIARTPDELVVLLPDATVQRVDAETLAPTGEPVAFPATGDTPQLGITEGTDLVAIDVRPHTQVLYGLGSDGQLYSLNEGNGTASKIGPPVEVLAGAVVGFDFNPTVDRLRIVTAEGVNLRINPDTGGVAATDGDLAYAEGDPNEGVDPAVTAASYTNSERGDLGAPLPASTTLYDIDTEADALVTQDPPNDGVLNTVGRLGVDLEGNVGFDISPDTGRAWLVAPTDGGSTAHRVDLRTGRAVPTGTSELDVVGVAVAPEAPAASGQGWVLSSGAEGHSVVAVDLDDPSTALAELAIGDVNPETTLVGLDVRGATGMPYVLGSDGQLYVLGAPKADDPGTVPAEPVGEPLPETALEAAGFDFNPAVDRLRIVAGTTNLRVNPNDGALAATDGDLAYVEGDLNEGEEPDVRAAAYTEDVRGGVATSTQLFDLDGAQGVLALQDPPNDGGLVTIGELGGDVGPAGGFDVQVGSGTALTVQPDGDGAPALWTVDLDSGALSPAGSLPEGLSVTGFAAT